MTQDITTGLGPEMYTLETAPEGEYRVEAKYYRADQNRTSAPTEVLMTVIKNIGRPNAERHGSVGRQRERHRGLPAMVEPEAAGDAAPLVRTKRRAHLIAGLGGLKRFFQTDARPFRPIGCLGALFRRVF